MTALAGCLDSQFLVMDWPGNRDGMIGSLMGDLLTDSTQLMTGHVAACTACGLATLGMSAMLAVVFGRMAVNALVIMVSPGHRDAIDIPILETVRPMAVHAGHGAVGITGTKEVALLVPKIGDTPIEMGVSTHGWPHQ